MGVIRVSPRGGPCCARPGSTIPSSEFAVNKLKAAGSQPGLYLLRRSPQDFDSYLLTVCAEVRRHHHCHRHRLGTRAPALRSITQAPMPGAAGVTGKGEGNAGLRPGARRDTASDDGPLGQAWPRDCCGHPQGGRGAGGGCWGDPAPLSLALPPQTRSGQDYKRCLIRRDEDGNFWLSGVARRFCSLQELLGTYGRCGLQAEGARMCLAACCPPLPKGDAARPGRRGGHRAGLRAPAVA